MHRAALTVALCLCTFIGACTPPIAFVPSGAVLVRHPNVTPLQIEVLHSGDPLPPYTEIGYIEANQTTTTGPARTDGLVERLAIQASAHGCNAIVLHDGCTREAWDRQGRSQYARLAATCIWIDH